MSDLLDDFQETPKSDVDSQDKKAFIASLIMFIGGILYAKFISKLGSQAGWSVVVSFAFIFQVLCVFFNTVGFIFLRLFTKNRPTLALLKSKLFWLDRIIGSVIPWFIFIGLALISHFQLL
ncbi:MAG: hypothetical protein AAF960_22580 [Bacteroidota bacterium]